MEIQELKHEQQISRLKLEFAAIGQRWLVERCFEDAVFFLHQKRIYPDSKMCSVNTEVQRNWQYLKRKLNIACDFPHVPGGLLYGRLSAQIHLPYGYFIFLATSEDANYRTFIRALAEKYSVVLESVDATVAAAGFNAQR